MTTTASETGRQILVHKNMYRDIALIVAALLVTCVATASAEIEGFYESFDGDGDFTGIDGFYVAWQGSLDWNFGSLSIVNEPGYDKTSQAYFSRILNGVGSFTQTIKVHNLDLGDLDTSSPTPSTGYVQLLFTIGEPTEDANRMMVFLIEPEGLDDSGLVSVEAKTSGTLGDIKVVELGSSIEFGMSFDSDAREVLYWYNANYDDPLSPLVELGPYAYTGTLEGESMVGMTFFAHWDGHASGLLDSWVLEPNNTAIGDFDFDGAFGLGDLKLLQSHIRNGTYEASLDIVEDDILGHEDVAFWVHDINGSYFGDADLDGEFSSADLINVFQAGEYEDDIVGNSTWSTGDWNADGEFTTGDLVIAFQDGGYEQGPRAEVSSVPEPSSVILLLLGACGFLRRRTVR